MGRAMLIICSGVLISLGIIGISTADIGLLLTQNSATYANDVTAKNAAHTGIQMAMHNISEDTTWASTYNSSNKWVTRLNQDDDDSIIVHVEYINFDWENNEYWKSDSIRIVSKGVINTLSPIESRHVSTISSVFMMDKFSALVPEPTGALQFPVGVGNLNTNGASHSINGADESCGETLPPITVSDETLENELESNETLLTDRDGDPVETDTTLDYEPTDELIERLESSGNVTYISGDYSEPLGTPGDPGVFFVEGDVSLTGGQNKGYGIMVVKNSANMTVQDPDDPTNELTIRGNFEWHGLLIFENANAFTGSGTPDIYGSVLIGDTDDNTQIDVDLSGNININYSCEGMNYAKKSAATTVGENKYTRVVTFEESFSEVK